MNKSILIVLPVFFIFGIGTGYCIENVGNRYGIDTTIGPYSPQNAFCPTNCGQCTAFAWGRALDRLGYEILFSQNYGRNACSWPDIITNQNVTIETDYTKPRANSLLIWGYDSPCDENNPGHVAYVEEVDGDDIYINEANIATYTNTQLGGGYDGYSKRLNVNEVVGRTGVGGPFKCYIYLDSPFSDYWYWDFDVNGTENWNAREAVNQGVFQASYWQIGSGFGDNSIERGVVSPELNNINTATYNAIEIKFGINNRYLDEIDIYYKINGIWRGPFTVIWISGPQSLGSQNYYRGSIPNLGQIQQVRFDFTEGSDTEDLRIYIDKISFISDVADTIIRVPYDYANIQDAIDATNNGDTILVAPGTYAGAGNTNLNFNGKSIHFKSVDGPNHTTLDCESSGKAFSFTNGETDTSIVEGFTITNGFVTANGGAVYCGYSSPTIENCKFTNNGTNGSDTVFYSGGAIFLNNSAAIISNCEFSKAVLWKTQVAKYPEISSIILLILT